MSAIIKGNARQAGSVQRVSEGAEVFLRHLRDGSLVGANWKQAAIFQGLGYIVNVGAFSTPIQGGGVGTVFDQDQPEFRITVPSGTSIMPLHVEIACQVPKLSAVSDETELLVAVDQDSIGGGGTATSETIYNMNTLKGNGSACTADSAFSVNTTAAPTLDLELMHKVLVAATETTGSGILWAELYGLYAPDAPPILNGPCQLLGYWGGTVATTGFAVVKWIEFPTTFAAI